ncbi:MAG: DNA-directed RNA polymerase subunit beta', partial [Eubacteriales bacterium]|nr:DNA-directed RNA polymerase subunit beta' [Eubacteriales bacterium]
TIVREGSKGEGMVFTDVDEALMAYETGYISLQAKVKIRMKRMFQGREYTKLVETSIGRVIFNQAVPQDMGAKPRNTPDDMFLLEVDEVVGKKQLGKIIDMCYRAHGVTVTATMLDNLKSLGYKFSTRAALTVSVADIIVPESKKTILAEAENQVHRIEREFRRGRLSENERYTSVIKIWEQATNDVTKQVMESLDRYNPINMMADSGARGSVNQIRQLAGMRGLMASPSGKIIELPIKANFREGLNVLEFFLSSHGSRKSLADTALKTADSGYMTRRLVDVSQENIVREMDCFASRGEKVRGLKVYDITGDGEVIESLEDRIRGRVSAETVTDPATGEVIVDVNDLITHDLAKRIVACGYKEITIRSVLTCQSSIGVCARCYGANMTNGKLVDVGEAVGIIAAQSIGEPGTQLTMRTFHTGGVATGADITQGLPRVEELFEARRPKSEAALAEITGIVHISTDSKKRRELIITSQNGDAEVKKYPINYGAKLKVEEGQLVHAGDELIEGSINPSDLLRILGIKPVQDYLVKEVQSVYRRQGIEIADKHIEVIVRQMLRKVKIEEANDTDLLPGSLVDVFRFEQANTKAIEAGGRPATAKRTLLGITKAALATESFLSAASFQETTRVLTEAAIKGKVDPLLGLKENVIIGKAIPAGTGLKRYSNVEIHEAY